MGRTTAASGQDRQKNTLARSLVNLPLDLQLRTSAHSTDPINLCAKSCRPYDDFNLASSGQRAEASTAAA
jgi:hypothetical protein